ncbi:MAG: tetrathionate reductase family octaheme c-type cytochrome [Candidatus Competibacterales bacterium]
MKTTSFAPRRLWILLWHFLILIAALVSVASGKPSTADHTQFEILQQDFQSGPEVTEACLSCHTEAARQVHRSIHWTWEYAHPETGQLLGKKNVINAFCGNIQSNEPRCTSCHVGYGWEDDSFDFSAENRVDCLVCHDRTGEYFKIPAGAGHPAYEPNTPSSGKIYQPKDLGNIARQVGMPGRENCGACHFYGGGGDGVKHGDLDSSLVSPDHGLDVHMAVDGANMACQDCHRGSGHQWAGSRYHTTAKDEIGTGKPGERREAASCESCHGHTPHDHNSSGLIQATTLDNHVDKVACQTCHIPEFARGGVATKTLWDWSVAGQRNEHGQPIKGHYDKNGQIVPGKNEHGHYTYLSIKGRFEYGEDVTPAYRWFQGDVVYKLLGETIDPSHRVYLNEISGSYQDDDARIWPFKIMQGRQAYDEVNNILVRSHVFGPNDGTSYWENLDWEKALAAGMSTTDVPFSGQHGFIDTAMYWPITHMVAPAADAVGCVECHTKDGRLAGLDGFYLPGRDKNQAVDRAGFFLLLVAILGVAGHGLLRLLTHRRRHH